MNEYINNMSIKQIINTNKQYGENNFEFLRFLPSFSYTLKREIIILDRTNKRKDLKNALILLQEALLP